MTDSLPPEKQKTGRPGNGGTIATAGGLVFVGATDDSRFRAFDAKSGKELWAFRLTGAAAANTANTALNTVLATGKGNDYTSVALSAIGREPEPRGSALVQ